MSKIVNIDRENENADWTKRTWDLPEYGSKEFKRFLRSSGMTIEQFKKLPVYLHYVKKKK